MLKRKCDLDLSSSLHLWWVMMSYALTPLTPVWCEVNVLSLSLSLFFYLLFVIVFLLLFICYYLFSNTIRPRTNIQKL